jgi:hypothetical protein
VAREGLADRCGEGAGGLLDGEVDGESSGGGAVSCGGFEGAGDEGLRDERAGGIVDGEPFD